MVTGRLRKISKLAHWFAFSCNDEHLGCFASLAMTIQHNKISNRALPLFISFMMGFVIHILNAPGFVEFIERFGYIGIFIWFITIDQISPIPEEISLLIIGYLCAHEVFHPLLAGLICLAGFVTADIAYYYLSRTGSKLIKKKAGKPKSSWMAS